MIPVLASGRRSKYPCFRSRPRARSRDPGAICRSDGDQFKVELLVDIIETVLLSKHMQAGKSRLFNGTVIVKVKQHRTQLWHHNYQPECVALRIGLRFEGHLFELFINQRNLTD